jgi:branched-chain amino acid transport system substrate-binding protein
MRVGAILAVTGPAAPLGGAERAVLIGMSEDRAAANGIELDIRDSGGDTARARVLFDSLAADPEIVAVIGPSTSAESFALAARADAVQLPLLSLAASKNIVLDGTGATRKWVFKFAQNDDIAAQRLADALRANGHTTTAMLFSNDVFGNGAAQAFRVAAASSIQIAHEASYAPQLQNADPVAAEVTNEPAVVIWGTTPGPALIVKALRARGYTGQIYLSHGNASTFFLEEAGAAAEGALVVGSRLLLPASALVAGNPADDVIRTYQMLWARIANTGASTFGGHAFDALEAIIAASGNDLRNRDASVRRAELRDRLEQLTGFHGVSGTFSFSPTDHAGLKPDAFTLYRIENGAFAVVTPAPGAARPDARGSAPTQAPRE